MTRMTKVRPTAVTSPSTGERPAGEQAISAALYQQIRAAVRELQLSLNP